jgi:hypothetical protein
MPCPMLLFNTLLYLLLYSSSIMMTVYLTSLYCHEYKTYTLTTHKAAKNKRILYIIDKFYMETITMTEPEDL